MDVVEPRYRIASGPLDDTPSPTHWIAKLRSRDFLEVAFTFALILLALWTARPMQTVVGWLTLLWVALATLRSRHDTTTLGLGLTGLRSSLWIAFAAVASAAVMIWMSSRMHTLQPVLRGTPLELSILAYLLWALLQQFILQDFFLLRMLRLLPNRTAAVVVTGMLFAVAHIPNPLLMAATLAWGITACALFVRYRNLYSLGLAHGILGVCLAIAVPSPLHHHMRVGIGYFRWHAQTQPVHRSQSNQMVSTEACVMADATSRCPSLHARP